MPQTLEGSCIQCQVYLAYDGRKRCAHVSAASTPQVLGHKDSRCLNSLSLAPHSPGPYQSVPCSDFAHRGVPPRRSSLRRRGCLRTQRNRLSGRRPAAAHCSIAKRQSRRSDVEIRCLRTERRLPCDQRRPPLRTRAPCAGGILCLRTPVKLNALNLCGCGSRPPQTCYQLWLRF